MGGVVKIRARELRKNPTEAERALWKGLRFRKLEGHKFRRQQPIGPYIVDFVCLEKRLIIEVDGGQHSKNVAYDLKRDAWLEAQGFSILRFWDHQVFKESEAVLEAVMKALSLNLNPPPQSSPARGEEVKDMHRL
jgi:adenine-specific DNA-methyltransferase